MLALLLPHGTALKAPRVSQRPHGKNRWVASPPRFTSTDEAVQSLIISDGLRCLTSLQCADECGLSALEAWHYKVVAWLDSRKLIVRWAVEMHLQRSVRAMGLTEVSQAYFGSDFQKPSLTLRSAIAPIEVHRVYLEAFRVAPLCRQRISPGCSSTSPYGSGSATWWQACILSRQA